MLKEDNKFDHINVEDPLSPEKGGFLKALMEDYERPKKQFQRYCEYPGFSRIDDLGLELNIPKINVCNKYKFDFPVADYSDGVTRDLRVIPYDIAVQRGLHLKSSLDFEDRAAEIMNKDIRVANEVTKTLTTNGLRREENFFLISLDELQDKSLSMVLDHFGREYASAKNAMPVFNDDKYAPAFERTEKLLNHFEIKLDHSILKDKRPDSGVDTIDKKDEFYRARHYEYKALYDAGHDIMYGTFYKTNPAGKSTVKMPYPINFRSTDDSWNDSKITAHHGIIPTTQVLDKSRLSEDEHKIYSYIVRVYLAQFFIKPVVSTTDIKMAAGPLVLKASGSVLLRSGYRQVLNQGPTHNTQRLPACRKGDTVELVTATINKDRTRPPAAYNEGSLIKAMENISSTVSHPEHKKYLKDGDGIGTSATRAEIIEELKRKGYLKVERKVLKITDKALKFLTHLPDIIKNPVLTAIYECNFSEIEKGKMSISDFENKVVRPFVVKQVNLAKGTKIK